MIADTLSVRWLDQDDFAVGWDFNYCHHVCGGIYSDRIVCPEYLHAIIVALAAAPMPDKWTHHTACETDTFDGEFFIRDGAVFLSDETEPGLLAKLRGDVGGRPADTAWR